MKTERREPPIELARCPFDSGPPILELKIDADTAHPGEIGMIDAQVWCHECGAAGPRRDTYAFDECEVATVALAACLAWNSAPRVAPPPSADARA